MVTAIEAAGAGLVIKVHVEDLAAHLAAHLAVHLAGRECCDAQARWAEIASADEALATGIG